MRVARTVDEARAFAQELPRPLGLVPTMGALHEGHLALVARARAECAAVLATIFVNPLQFGLNEDFAKYPRAFPEDTAKLEAAGVALLFAPGVDDMVPTWFDTAVDPGGLAGRFEGYHRPGHFRGVATICTKLFAISGANRAYFGAKDAQQCAVLAQVVRDLALPVELAFVPTVRDADGLALSSRNAYLSASERAAAPGLYHALQAMADAAADGEVDRERIVTQGRRQLMYPLEEVYLDVVDAASFVPADRIDPIIDAKRSFLAVGSVRIGTTRLIDNVAITVAA